MNSPLTDAANLEDALPRSWSPFDVRIEPIARFLNAELVDHAVYDGFELQYFDDALHGTGMLAFLQRRADRLVDYYMEPGLVLDRSGYEIAGGIGEWVETPFEAARLEITRRGVDAEVRFRDVAGRLVEVRVDDRGRRCRRRAALLAPVSAAIERPTSLMLVYLHNFDLVHVTRRPPVIRIDGQDVSTGALPGRWLHRRHLIKTAAPLSVVTMNQTHDGPRRVGSSAEFGGTVKGVLTDDFAEHSVRLSLRPPFPDPTVLSDGEFRQGRWTIDIDRAADLTGGTWSSARDGDEVHIELDVTKPWRPGPLPLLMRIVIRVIPTFRRWPTTYRWTATLRVGATPTMTSRWQRTDGATGEAYRRATQRGH